MSFVPSFGNSNHTLYVHPFLIVLYPKDFVVVFPKSNNKTSYVYGRQRRLIPIVLPVSANEEIVYR
jgi:hypothetical protein